MKQLEEASLLQAAKAAGIQTEYVNDAGRTNRVSSAAIGEILEALRSPPPRGSAAGSAERALIVEPVFVFWGGALPRVTFLIPLGLKETDFHFEIKGEQGAPFSSEVDLTVKTSAQTRKAELRFRKALPIGYYTLSICSPAGSADVLLISAPLKAYGSEDLPRQWGIFAPMYALRSSKAWGGGTFSDFQQLGRFVAEMGGDFVGSLPLTATFLSKPFEPSPYSPASRLFWSEYFIDVQTAPELQHSRPARKLLESDSFKRSVKQFRSSPTVSYVQEMQLKRRALEALAETLDRSRGARREAFEQFLRLRPDAQEYAAFRAVGEKLQSSWHTWPEQARRGRITPADYREADFRYHLYAQFLAQEQISALLRAYERDGVSLYLDLPVGVNSDSYDVWRNRSQFVSSVSCGAPPDIFFREGQDWGFPPLNPIELRKSHYAYWRKVMRFQLKHAKLLRLDHVMGLHRLYWIPHGRSAKDGAYVHYNAEELFAILCVESHLNEAVVIGENLGTVPQEITRAMRKHSVRGMSILQFEHQPRQPALKEPPRAVLATLDTHDTPTFAAFVTGADIALRQTLGLLKAKEVASERRRRQKLIKAFADFLKKRRLITSSEPNPTDLLRGALRWLAKGRADIVLIPLEDLWLEINAQNVPGTTDQHPNWQRKARLTLEEMLGSVHVRTLLNEVSEARHPAQRTIHKSRTQK